MLSGDKRISSANGAFGWQCRAAIAAPIVAANSIGIRLAWRSYQNVRVLAVAIRWQFSHRHAKNPITPG
jgi:hypothetical protein